MPKRNTPIDPALVEACKETKPQWLSTTAFVNQMIWEGLRSIDRYDKMGLPSDTKEKTKTKNEGSTYTNRVPNSINKDKEILKKTKFRFSKDLIPFELSNLADQIEKFWKVKTGRKSEEAFNLLISNLIAIKKKYKEQACKEQIELAIVGGPKGPWSSVTLRNYETFAKQKSWEPEPTANHPASRVFKNGKFEDQ